MKSMTDCPIVETMTRLDDMRLFAQLAESGSLTRAAMSLGITKQTVSRRLAELEGSLGVELARRTTRRLTLTDVGRAYAARCSEVVRLADEANRAAASQLDVVSGVLRVTADNTFGEAFLPDLITAYLSEHEGVDVEVWLTSRKVDLLEEGFDVAFRVGPPPDVAHLAATRLGPATLCTVATAAYLKRQGLPRTVADLAGHACIAVVPNLAQVAWPLLIDGVVELVRVSARVRVNGVAMGRRAALAGAGIAHLPAFAVAADVHEGRLVPVLSRHAPEVGGVNVIYPHSRLLAPKVSEFVALAVSRFCGRNTVTSLA